LGRNFNPQFFRYRRWFEACLYSFIGDGGGAAQSIVHITVAVGGLFERKVIGLQITVTVGSPIERSLAYIHIKVAVWVPVKA